MVHPLGHGDIQSGVGELEHDLTHHVDASLPLLVGLGLDVPQGSLTELVPPKNK